MRPRRRSVQRKPFIAYILPLLTSILFIVLIVMAVNTWVNYSSSSQNTALSDKALATFTVTGQNTFIVLDGKDHRLGQDSTSQLFSGEGIATGAGTRQYVELMGKGYFRLDNYSTVFVKKQANAQILNVGKGSVWLYFEKADDDVKELKVKIKNGELTVTAGSKLHVSNINGRQMVAVMEGKAQMKILNDQASILREVLIEEKQQVYFEEQDLATIAEKNIVVALDQELIGKDWYDWNIVEDQKTNNYESPVITNTNAEGEKATPTNTNEATSGKNPVSVDNLLNGDVFTTTSITVKGTLLVDGVTAVSVNGKQAELSQATKTWAAYKVPLSKDGKNTLLVKATAEGVTTTIGSYTVTRDVAVPDTPVLSSSKTVSVSPAVLAGTVAKDVVRVDVNGYTLKKFVPGSGVWQYTISTEIENMKSGENSYRVVAYDKGGNPSAPLVATITYTGDTKPKNGNTNTVNSSSNNNANTTMNTNTQPVTASGSTVR